MSWFLELCMLQVPIFCGFYFLWMSSCVARVFGKKGKHLFLTYSHNMGNPLFFFIWFVTPKTLNSCKNLWLGLFNFFTFLSQLQITFHVSFSVGMLYAPSNAGCLCKCSLWPYPYLLVITQDEFEVLICQFNYWFWCQSINLHLFDSKFKLTTTNTIKLMWINVYLHKLFTWTTWLFK